MAAIKDGLGRTSKDTSDVKRASATLGCSRWQEKSGSMAAKESY